MITRSSLAAAALAATLFASVSVHAAGPNDYDLLKTPDWTVKLRIYDNSEDMADSNGSISQSCALSRKTGGDAIFALQEEDKGALQLVYFEHGVKWTEPVSITLQIDDNAPWSGQVQPYKDPDGGTFSMVFIPIQRPVMDEFRHGTQVKFTANGHTQALALSGPVAELAFTEMDHCVATILAERLARWPLQKRVPAAPSSQLTGTGSR
jgi:hypothetical protein